MKLTPRWLLTALVFTACKDAASPSFAPTELGLAKAVGRPGATTLPTFGGGSAGAEAINDAGVVVGYALEPNISRTVLGAAYAAKWTRDPGGQWQVVRLGALPGVPAQPGGRALAINASGDAVGTRANRALAWPASGGEVDIGDGVAEGINTAGTIVGGTTWNTASSALAWTRDPAGSPTWTAQMLPSLPGGTLSHAFSINEAGVITGSAMNFEGRWKAVVWSPAEVGWSQPVLLAEVEATPGQSGGFSINTLGDVAGYLSACVGCSVNASAWPEGGGRIDLTLLNSGATSGHAIGIDDGGRVVGFVTLRNGKNAFLWTPGSTALTMLGAGTANDINNGSAAYGREAVGVANSSSNGAGAVVWRIP